MNDSGHITVLPEPVMDLLVPVAGDVAVDCTVGRGGHALQLAEAIGEAGRLVMLDVDAGNLAYASTRLAGVCCPVDAVHSSFVRVGREVMDLGVRANVVLADLGFSSSQMDDASRGLSFGADGPLDMRLNPSSGPTAADLVAAWSESELTTVIRRYGEDPFAAKIARKLVQTRSEKPIVTTAQLAELVREAYGSRARQSRMHPATRTFMALRIAVNDELAALEALLDQIARGAEAAPTGSGWLAPGARIGIISFHSLEDRLVKHAFSELVRRDLVTRLTPRPVTADDLEVAANPRSRSAKLRVIRLADSMDG